MGSTSNYNSNAIKCLMSIYQARNLVEYSKHTQAATMTHSKGSSGNQFYPEKVFNFFGDAKGAMKETSLHGVEDIVLNSDLESSK
jgi:hypothetical protein